MLWLVLLPNPTWISFKPDFLVSESFQIFTPTRVLLVSDYYPGELVLSGLVWAFFLIFLLSAWLPTARRMRKT